MHHPIYNNTEDLISIAYTFVNTCTIEYIIILRI